MLIEIAFYQYDSRCAVRRGIAHWSVKEILCLAEFYFLRLRSAAVVCRAYRSLVPVEYSARRFKPRES